MSEYMEKFAVSRLVGAPPGYVGYEEGGQLTEAVRRRPYQVVLLDEIEKAHPDVFNVLLQVLDDGRLTDSPGPHGRLQEHRRDHDQQRRQPADPVGRGRGRRRRGLRGDEAPGHRRSCAAQFRPEFLNRIDEVIVFHALTDAELAAIADLLLADLQRRIADNDLGARADAGRAGADRARRHRSGVRRAAAQADDPAPGREPVRAGAAVGLVQARRPDRRGRGPGVRHARVLERVEHGGRGRLGPARRPRDAVAREPAAAGAGRRERGPRSTCRRSTSRRGPTAASSSTSRAGAPGADALRGRPSGASSRCRPAARRARTRWSRSSPRPARRGRGRRGTSRDVGPSGRGADPASTRTTTARRGSCSPSGPTAAAITRARSRSRAARPSRETPTSSPPPCARRARRSGLDADAAGVRVLGLAPGAAGSRSRTSP